MNYAEEQRSPRKHLTGITIVVVFHIFIVWALVTGLARSVVEVIKQPLTTKIIEEVKPPPPPDNPPPPPPKLAAPPPPFIPPPEVNVQVPVQQTQTITTTTAPPPPVFERPAPPPPVVAPPGPRTPVRTAPVLNAAENCEKPAYPMQSRRSQEQGTVTLQFTIETDGTASDGQVLTSSGYPRLDRAALEGLRRCKFRPGTTDGKPERSQARLQYEWKLGGLTPRIFQIPTYRAPVRMTHAIVSTR